MTNLTGALLTETHPAVEVGSHRPFLLRGDGAWVVAAGNVDVFSTAVCGEEAVGARRHLFRAETGGLLLGHHGSSRGFDFLAVGTEGTRLVETSRDELQKLAAEPSTRQLFQEVVDVWVELLCSSLADQPPPDDCVELEVGEYLANAESARVRPGRSTLWIRHQAGTSRLLGRRSLGVNGDIFTPFSGRVWLEVAKGNRIEARNTQSLLGEEGLWQGLDRLYELSLDYTVDRAEQATRAERERLHRRTEAESMALNDACTSIAGALQSSDRPSAQGTAAEERNQKTPLLAACAVLGEATGIAVLAPPTAMDRGVREYSLDAIAKSSGFRTRQVLLRGGWWREDGGGFLAYLTDDKRPVAILPTRGSRYEMHDPSTGRTEPVTEAVSLALEPLAYSFYRPFAAQRVTLKGLLSFGLHGSRRDVMTILAMAAASGLLSLVMPMATRRIFNDVIPGAARSELLQLTLMLLVVAVASALLNMTGALAQVRVEGRAGAAIQGAMWDRLLSLSMPFFRPYTAGDLANRAMGIETIRQLLSGPVVSSLLAGVFSLLHFALLFYYSQRLALWASVLIAVAVGVTALVGRRQMLFERRVAAVRTKLAGTVLQFLSCVSKLRVAGAEVHAFAFWARRFSEQRRFQLSSRRLSNGLVTFTAGYPLVANLVIFALSAQLLSSPDQPLRTGDFLAFVASFTICLHGMLNASSALLNTAAIIPLYEQAHPILHTLPEVDPGKADPGRLSGDIEVQHLSFRYESDGPAVLRDLTLEVKAGEFVALVGPSGSGKSTLLRLLLGFESPESGGIYYDGQVLAGLNHQAVRSQIGVVLQNGRLMAGDLFTNIVGSSRATLEDAWEAARMAGLEKDIEAMPMAMHTVVSEGGGTLSGGQRQRLLIAQAMVRKPRILLLDEATSALDNRTQAIVSDSLSRMQATRIVVAHRLSTIVHADRIYVLEGGRLVETGNYNELIEKGGLFAELAKRQLV